MWNFIISAIVAGLSLWSCYKKAKQYRTSVWEYLENYNELRVALFVVSATCAAISLIFWVSAYNF